MKHKNRTTEEARDALSRFCTRGSVMSVPVDKDRDADFILSDVITERDELKEKLAEVERESGERAEIIENHRDARHELEKKLAEAEKRASRTRALVQDLHRGISECGCDLEVNSLCEFGQIEDALQ